MSHLPRESRPKLIPKRSTRFEPSSSFLKGEGNDGSIQRQGSKRTNTEDDGYDLIKPKRICITSSASTSDSSYTKNLANNRLKRLKEQIVASASTTQKERNVSKDTFERNRESNSSSTNVPVVLPTSSKKNLAANRLQKLKRKLSFNDSNTQTPGSSRDKLTESRHSSPKQLQSFVSESNENKSAEINTMTGYKSDLSGKCTDERRPLEDYDIEENKNKANVSTLSTSPLNMSVGGTGSDISDISNSSFHKPVDLSPKKVCDSSNNRGVAHRLLIRDNHASGSSINMTTSWIENQQTLRNDETINKAESDLFRECTNDDSMEWMEPDEVVDTNQNNKPPIETGNQTEVENSFEKSKDVCVVVDTNVFISGLCKIRDIVNFKSTGPSKPIIYVPWMVITELDYMKDASSASNSKLSNSINNAIKFINNALNLKNVQIVGQTVFEVEKQQYVGPSPDDKIIGCCLQAAEKYETVILLSNDVNLKNKAMINDISCCSSNEIVVKIISKLAKNTKTQRIMHKLGIMCSSIICDCMKEVYGDIWTKMDMMRCPPWSLLECLKRFKKYWTTVFRDKVMKQFVKTVQGFQDLLEANKYFSDDSDEFIEFMKLSVTTCVYLKDIEGSRNFVENTLADITKIAQ